MALSHRRRFESVNYWPGFVDALSTMLLVIIFLLSVFMLAQFFLSREVTGKDTALAKLNQQIEELTSLLALERSQKSEDQTKIASLTATLEASQSERQHLLDAAAEGGAGAEAEKDRAAAAANALDSQREISAKALAQVDILNQQISALRKQLAAIQEALEASKSSGREVAGQDRRPRPAAQHRAGAKGAGARALPLRLLRALTPDPRRAPRHPRRRRPLRVRILGAVRIGQGRRQPRRQAVARTRSPRRCSTSSARFRPTFPGFCASTAIPTRTRSPGGQFKSNWELSAARAIAVVQYLISKGIEPTRLAAAGFGEFQPIDPATDDEALAHNRRIELKLTER